MRISTLLASTSLSPLADRDLVSVMGGSRSRMLNPHESISSYGFPLPEEGLKTGGNLTPQIRPLKDF